MGHRRTAGSAEAADPRAPWLRGGLRGSLCGGRDRPFPRPALPVGDPHHGGCRAAAAHASGLLHLPQSGLGHPSLHGAHALPSPCGAHACFNAVGKSPRQGTRSHTPGSTPRSMFSPTSPAAPGRAARTAGLPAEAPARMAEGGSERRTLCTAQEAGAADRRREVRPGALMKGRPHVPAAAPVLLHRPARTQGPWRTVGPPGPASVRTGTQSLMQKCFIEPLPGGPLAPGSPCGWAVGGGGMHRRSRPPGAPGRETGRRVQPGAHTVRCVWPGHSRPCPRALRSLTALRREGHLLGASPGLPGGGGVGAGPGG